jgi:hypothetical protein
MMATFIQKSTDGTPEKPPNHTLEDVAEEVLNGIFCHYEPPDPRRNQPKKRRGILRTPKVFRRNRSDGSNKSVRWSDTKEVEIIKDIPPTPNATLMNCNLKSMCMDAGIEAGCVSPRSKDAAMKNEEDVNIIDIRHGAISSQGGKIKTKKNGDLIPPPPPPAAKEKFIDSFCGVDMNCGEDDDIHKVKLANSSHDGGNKTYNRPRQDYDYEDDDDAHNSLVDESDDDEQERLQKEKLRRRMKEMRKRQQRARVEEANRQLRASSSTEDEEEGDDSDIRSNVSGASSLFRRVFYKGGRKSSESKSSDRKIVANRSSARSRSPSPGRKIQRRVSADMANNSSAADPIISVRGEGDYSGSKWLRRLSPRSRKEAVNETDDWDQSIPIVPTRTRVLPPAKTPPASAPVILGGRPKQEKHAMASDSDSLQNSSNRNSTGSRGRGSEARDPSPDVRRTRSKSPGLPRHPEVGSGKMEQRSQSKSPGKSNSSSLSKNYQGIDPVHVASSRPVQPAKVGPLVVPAEQLYPQFHPAHPLNAKVRKPEDDRDSFITAHRIGFDGSIIGCGSDMTERQSLITAHREAFDERARKAGFLDYDDMIERQSFIMASRDDMDNSLIRKCGPGLATVVEDDRQSFITAHRQGYEQPQSQHPGFVMDAAESCLATITHNDSRPVLQNDLVQRPVDNHSDQRPTVHINPVQEFEQRRAGHRIQQRGISMVEIKKQTSRREGRHSLSIPFLSRGRSKSPKKTKSKQRRASSLDRSVSDMSIHRSDRSATPPLRSTLAPSTLSVDQQATHRCPPQPAYMHQSQLLNQSPALQSQQAMVQNHIPPEPLPNCWAPQVFDQPVVVLDQLDTASKPVPSDDNAETTWEERTRSAWEKLRSGLGLNFGDEAPKDDNLKNNTQTASTILNQTAGSQPQPTFLLSPPHLTPVQMQQLQQMSPQVTPLQLQQMIQLIQMQQIMMNQGTQSQGSLQTLTAAPLQSSVLMQPENQSKSPQLSHQRPGILKQPSFEKQRRVTFGSPRERIFHDGHDENCYPPSPKKTKKVFKGHKLIMGMFGRKNKGVSNQQTLPSSSTRSTELSSNPSADSAESRDNRNITYSLSEEWDGGQYYYSAGPRPATNLKTHNVSSVDMHQRSGPVQGSRLCRNNSLILDSGCMNTLANILPAMSPKSYRHSHPVDPDDGHHHPIDPSSSSSGPFAV